MSKLTHSLSTKLIVAFLIVSITGTLISALLAARQTRNQFDELLFEQAIDESIGLLAQYYAEVGSWEDVDSIYRGSERRAGGLENEGRQGTVSGQRWRLFGIVADVDGIVVRGDFGRHVGDTVDGTLLANADEILVDGELVGYLVTAPAIVPRRPPEQAFLNRLNQLFIISAIGGTLSALFLGILLARGLTRPIHDLIRATRAVAAGTLGTQVEVRSKDELGELSHSFNQMSADLKKALEARQQMTADVAHDLRTPLAVLMGYTESLSDGVLEPTQELFDVMHREANQLNRLVEDLRTLSLADADELTLFKEAIDPITLLTLAADSFRVQAEQKGVALTIEPPPVQLPELQVDAQRMQQVLGNLVGNALRFTPAGGQINLSAQQTDNLVALIIKDTGDGINPEALPYIFDRFYREESSRYAANGESGLGLAIARSIIVAHGGKIAVESALGEGTVFVVSLEAA